MNFLKKNFQNLIKLARIMNSIMAFFGVFLGSFVAKVPINNFMPVFLAAISASFIAAFGNIDNDIIDIKIDQDEGKNRPLATGVISIAKAKIFRLVTLLIGNIVVINYPILFTVSISVSILLLAYNRFLKQRPLIGNIVVAFMVGLTFLYGNLLSIYLSPKFNYDLIPFFLAFFINLARELTKDCEDIKGDSTNNIKTFPIVFGINITKRFIQIFNFLLLITIILTPLFFEYTYKFYIMNSFTTIPIILWNSYKLNGDLDKKEYRKVSKMYKIAMLTGVLSLFIDKISI